jgi:hypothetical protein
MVARMVRDRWGVLGLGGGGEVSRLVWGWGWGWRDVFRRALTIGLSR